MGIEKGSIREAFSIPFQQTARYVAYFEDEVTNEEREAIGKVLNYETLGENYNPIISDPVKGHYHGDSDSLKEYFKVWLKMFFKHPRVYFDAGIHQAYGYLAPVEPNADARIILSGGWLNRKADLNIDRTVHHGYAEFLDGLCVSFNSLPILGLLNSPGLYEWILTSCAVFLLMKRKYTEAIPFIAVFLNLLVCIASPLHNSTRYSLWIICMVPLLVWWTVMNIKNAEQS